MIETLSYQTGVLDLLDQTLLPGETRVLSLTTVEQVHEAIRSLRVRGAPAIGGAAAYGMCLAGEALPPDADSAQALAALLEARDYLAGARPTAVNLFWALDRMLGAAEAFAAAERTFSAGDLRAELRREADAIRTEDADMCRAIGAHGLELLGGAVAVMTHCNAGRLATMGIGTALAPVYLAAEGGRRIHVYANETRPLLQGARITSWELSEAGLPVTLITDSMAAHVMRQGRVEAVIVGADRVAANGDVANKIGTYGLALLAKAHDLPFYVAAPSSTVDFGTPTGAEIRIEERLPDEVRRLAGRAIAPSGVEVLNPAFDVTPAALISGIVTERGVALAPYESSLPRLLGG
ncbi:MAG: S-methyl-5-thioribose-1-phosphate isomerase [Trueperaceae bacterium]|nr:S-methyl-5-thioribose-1-phosphate isomerase [Trueperaceae bacterium]